jgi:hypothetical protein
LDDTDQTAASQIRALLGRLPAGGSAPLFVFDGGYDSAQLTLDLADAGVAVLVRLRSDRCFYADPPPRPRHPSVAADHARHHPPRPGRAGPRSDAPAEGAVAMVGRPGGLQAGSGPGVAGVHPPVRPGTHRRFAKQTLGWTIPRPRHPEQADRWTWLVLAGYTQLRLARDVVADRRLPWERPRPQPRLSPYRVRRGFPRLLCALGSPAATPKPSGCSPGRPKGRCSGPATRYPAIKKPAKTPRKKPPRTAKAA